jgi:hypothetical protein
LSYAVFAYCLAQEAHLPLEAHASDAPRQVQFQQYAVHDTKRAFLSLRDEMGGTLARDEVTERSFD